MTDDRFLIPLNGLAAGENRFSWQIGKEFFESFDNSEILDAQLVADVIVEKSGRYIGVDCEVEGELTVECDRCLDDLVMPVDTSIRLSVKFGEEDSSEEAGTDSREVIFVSETDMRLDMSQVIYDYVCLCLPMQRMHELGDCNEEVIKRYACEGDVVQEDEAVADNPFAALKGLF